MIMLEVGGTLYVTNDRTEIAATGPTAGKLLINVQKKLLKNSKESSRVQGPHGIQPLRNSKLP